MTFLVVSWSMKTVLEIMLSLSQYPRKATIVRNQVLGNATLEEKLEFAYKMAGTEHKVPQEKHKPKNDQYSTVFSPRVCPCHGLPREVVFLPLSF